MAGAEVYTSHCGGGVGEAYTCDTPVSAFRDACAVCVWLEQAIHSALCIGGSAQLTSGKRGWRGQWWRGIGVMGSFPVGLSI